MRGTGGGMEKLLVQVDAGAGREAGTVAIRSRSRRRVAIAGMLIG